MYQREKNRTKNNKIIDLKREIGKPDDASVVFLLLVCLTEGKKRKFMCHCFEVNL